MQTALVLKPRRQLAASPAAPAAMRGRRVAVPASGFAHACRAPPDQALASRPGRFPIPHVRNVCLPTPRLHDRRRPSQARPTGRRNPSSAVFAGVRGRLATVCADCRQMTRQAPMQPRWKDHRPMGRILAPTASFGNRADRLWEVADSRGSVHFCIRRSLAAGPSQKSVCLRIPDTSRHAPIPRQPRAKPHTGNRPSRRFRPARRVP